jgi:hypothetical protein
MYKGPNKVIRFLDGVSVLAIERQDGTVLPCLIDTVDYPLVKDFRWVLRNGYAALKQPIYLHTLLTGCIQTDHRDLCRLNNRRKNLRSATTSQNVANRPLSVLNTSGFKGVRRSRTKWRADIRQNGIKKSLGTFNNPVDAAKAYDAAALQTFGEFARINFPIDNPPSSTVE